MLVFIGIGARNPENVEFVGGLGEGGGFPQRTRQFMIETQVSGQIRLFPWPTHISWGRNSVHPGKLAVEICPSLHWNRSSNSKVSGWGELGREMVILDFPDELI